MTKILDIEVTQEYNNETILDIRNILCVHLDEIVL